MNGGFAEYCAYPAGKVFKIHNLTDVDATLLEPAACAAHGLEKIAPKFGSSVLMFGAGPTGMHDYNTTHNRANACIRIVPCPASAPEWC